MAVVLTNHGQCVLEAERTDRVGLDIRLLLARLLVLSGFTSTHIHNQ